MHIQKLEHLQELDAQQAAKISGGRRQAEGVIAWSIGFADVVRPSSSQTLGAIGVTTGMSS